MPVLVLEGPDGLGKSALAQLIQEHSYKFVRRVAALRVPEPSKQFGKFPNALAYAVDELQNTPRELLDPPGFVLFDRFPIPSEFVYNSAYGLVSNDPEYQEHLELLSYYSYWKFVLIMPDESYFMSSNLRARLDPVLADDPMYSELSTSDARFAKWRQYYYRYITWSCHNRNPLIKLIWTPTTVWDEKTVNKVLMWAFENPRRLA